MSVPFSKGVDAHTRYRAVLGHPVRHSASPEMQNAGMAALGLNWRYLAFDVEPGGLGRAIAGAAALELWTGKPAPVEEMRKALLQKLLGKSN